MADLIGDARRMHQGRRATVEEGGYVGGPLPFGLHLDAWGRWERDEVTAQLLLKMFERYRSDPHLPRLCRWLNDELQVSSPGGKRWVPASAHRVLKNPMYRRTVQDIPLLLTGQRYERAVHNYTTTGILAEDERPRAAATARGFPHVTVVGI